APAWRCFCTRSGLGFGALAAFGGFGGFRGFATFSALAALPVLPGFGPFAGLPPLFAPGRGFGFACGSVGESGVMIVLVTCIPINTLPRWFDRARRLPASDGTISLRRVKGKAGIFMTLRRPASWALSCAVPSFRHNPCIGHGLRRGGEDGGGRTT